MEVFVIVAVQNVSFAFFVFCRKLPELLKSQSHETVLRGETSQWCSLINETFYVCSDSTHVNRRRLWLNACCDDVWSHDVSAAPLNIVEFAWFWVHFCDHIITKSWRDRYRTVIMNSVGISLQRALKTSDIKTERKTPRNIYGWTDRSERLFSGFKLKNMSTFCPTGVQTFTLLTPKVTRVKEKWVKRWSSVWRSLKVSIKSKGTQRNDGAQIINTWFKDNIHVL